jgi:hypothetical protein
VQAFNAHFIMGAALLRGGFDLAATFRFRLAAAAVPPGNASLRRLATAQEAELRGRTDEAEAEFRGAEASARRELEHFSSSSSAAATAAAAAAAALSRALAGQARW